MEPIKLLMIDDNLDDCALYAHAFKQAGSTFQLQVVNNGEAAFDLLDQGAEFDCILLDYQLAHMTGVELLHRLQERFGDLPSAFIMLTDIGGERHVVEAMQAGVFDYLTKSDTSQEELLHAVKKASHMTRVRRQLALQSAWRVQAEEELRQAQLRSAELAGVRKAVATYLHEINSPLAGIIGYLDILLQDERAPDLQVAFGEMLSACDQIRHVLRSMEDLDELRPRQGTGNRGPLDLPKLGRPSPSQERPAQA
jgi:CheY-like chemotaxis protein